MSRELVWVVDRCPIVREGLRALLQTMGAEVIGVTERIAEAVSFGAEHRIEAVILGPAIPSIALLPKLRLLRKRVPTAHLVVFRLTEGAEFAVRSVEAGASAFLSQVRSFDELSSALRSRESGRRFFSPAIVEQLEDRARCDARPLHARLSGREFEVFTLLGAGLTVGQVATQLDISPKTVSTHRARIREKTGLLTTSAIIRYSLENSILRSPNHT